MNNHFSGKKITLTISDKLENTSFVGGAIRGICSTHQFPETVSSRIELCVIEAVTNCIKHAYAAFDEINTVKVTVELSDNKIKIEVCDKGHQIPRENLDSATTPLSVDPNNIELLPVGGMGLKLIVDLMDSVEYKVKDGWNCLLMEKSQGTDLE